MAVDPFTEEPLALRALAHELGQDLSTLSVDELNERIEILEREIARLVEARGKKEASRAAADAFFRS